MMTPDMTHEQWLQDQLNLANEHCDQLRDQLRAERDSLKAELADEKKAHEYTKELLTGTAKQILDLEAALRAQASPDAVTDSMVLAGACAINEMQAKACNVDADDQWKIYSEEFKADARIVLNAALKDSHGR